MAFLRPRKYVHYGLGAISMTIILGIAAVIALFYLVVTLEDTFNADDKE